MLGVIVSKTVMRPAAPEVTLPDAPRNVRVRAEAKKRLRIMRTIAVVSLVVGLWMSWASLKEPLTKSFGMDKVARVDAVSPVKGDKLARWFDVTFSYETAGGAKRVGYGTVDMAGDQPPLVGSGIAIKALELWPLNYSMVKEAGGGIGAVVLGIFPVIFTVIAIALTLTMWIGPELQKRLVRSGKATMGTVAQKMIQRTKGVKQHTVFYRFQAENGETWGSNAALSAEKFAKMSEGDRVEVIYAAGRPWKSVMYDEAVYEVV